MQPSLTADGADGALPYHPQTCARYTTHLPPSLQAMQITGSDTLEKLNFKHSELNAQPLDLNPEILEEQQCCLSRAGLRKQEQKLREETNPFSL